LLKQCAEDQADYREASQNVIDPPYQSIIDKSDRYIGSPAVVQQFITWGAASGCLPATRSEIIKSL
jgi:hypothetical protein